MKHIKLSNLVKPQNEGGGKEQLHWKLAGKPVTINKHNSNDENRWTVDFDGSNKTIPFKKVVDVLQ